MKRPQNVSFLERGIRSLVDSNDKAYRLRVLMSNVVVGQFLRGGVVRGGTSMKLRYGAATTRFTMDFDVARNVGLELFMEEFSKRLEEGWCEFTGVVVKVQGKHPRGVPMEYVMHPYDIKLQYRGHPWCTVRLEVSYDEIGDADVADETTVPNELANAFAALGFPKPNPIPLMTIPYQIAQKLHGLTEPGSLRVQDLVDLQLIVENEALDFVAIRSVCARLFANRQMQTWPSKVSKNEGWDDLYDTARQGIPGVRGIDDAVSWINGFIGKIDAAQN